MYLVGTEVKNAAERKTACATPDLAGFPMLPQVVKSHCDQHRKVVMPIKRVRVIILK